MSENIRSRDSAVRSPSDLPPPRDRKKATRSVSPPLSHVPLKRFNYLLALFATLLVVFYAWRLAQWKADVGGWWNLALGRRPPAQQNPHPDQHAWAQTDQRPDGVGEPGVEQRIEELARALGLPSGDLARAIADAVREHVPPASLSSVAAHETGDAVKYVVDPSGAAASDAESAPASTASRGFGVVQEALEAAVGLDEPPSALGREV
ncbi:uncharacterized protein FIBRA_04842 [Fibroporia radiculosa]|uniref:Uncharacterized protein n=1 Tax=Fibroporia radiculosa TaxID=599839 RepID=J4GPX0_9APHY|nr:uncharacterized protein FIBRA_04842 [Fibroporia radiculosa]CCM02735.1 predicted protein [Fibroporia radiculosa]